jgi:riboflavin kinase/FMN adenylyltransferase
VSIPQLDALSGLRLDASVVTIGTFDGVHLGHQHLITSAISRASDLGLPVAVLTFEPIPAAVLRPDQFPGRICPVAEKLAQIQRFEPDHLITIPFDLDLASWLPGQFMAAVHQSTRLRELWVGEAFALGKGRSGGVEQLTEIGEAMGYSVCAIQRREDIDGVISSSRIRHAIQLGDVSLANRLLGRPFTVTGEVIHGAQFGRTIGYPTANVAPPADQAPLADGIYASRAHLPGESALRQSMTYVGTRPSVNAGARQIETNILDFDGDLYGQIIRVELLQRLRPDAFFPTIEALVAQVRQDEIATRAFFIELTETLD